MYDLITVGSLVKDVYLVSDAFQLIRSSKFLGGTGGCVSLGAKHDVEELYITTGGGAGNVAATAASCHLHAACISRVGDDETGEALLNDLKERNIATELIDVVEGGMSGYSALLTTQSGERSILTHRGVSGEFDALSPKSELDTRWLHFTSLGGSLSKIRELISAAGSATISWNPGGKELAQGLDVIKPILEDIDVLNLNKEEAEALLGVQGDAKTLAAKLHELVPVALVTDGPRGTIQACESGLMKAIPRNIASVSRTGAGDAFMGGYITGRLHDMSFAESLQFASLNAESVIQKFGAKEGVLDSVPSHDDLNQIHIQPLSL
jgi:sugar/nucleoside kinase (ribokinase family)